MNKKIIKIYYLILGIFVVSQVIYTLYSGGSLLYNRRKISQLRTEYQQLEDQKNKFESIQSKQISLKELLNSDELKGFSNIDQPISIQTSTSIALERQ